MFLGHGSNSHQKGSNKGINACDEEFLPSVWSVNKFTRPPTSLYAFGIALEEKRNNKYLRENKLEGQYQVVGRLSNLDMFHAIEHAASR